MNSIIYIIMKTCFDINLSHIQAVTRPEAKTKAAILCFTFGHVIPCPMRPLAAKKHTTRLAVLILRSAPTSFGYLNLFQRSDMNSIVYIIINPCFDIDLSHTSCQNLHNLFPLAVSCHPSVPPVVSLLNDYGNETSCWRGLEATLVEVGARARHGRKAYPHVF